MKKCAFMEIEKKKHKNSIKYAKSGEKAKVGSLGVIGFVILVKARYMFFV